MNIKEIRQKTDTELQAEIAKIKKEIVDFKMNILHGKEKNVKKSGVLKKNIAQLNTVLNERAKQNDAAASFDLENKND